MRLRRLRHRAFFILQCGVGAGAAWWIANDLLHHEQPFFAPVTAMICLGMSYGQRVRRVADVMLGVAIGVLIGDLFIHYFGSGVWQIILVAVLAMSVATLLGARLLLVTQAGLQAVIVTTLVAQPGQAFSRWLDAVIGGSLALVLTLVAPAAPVRRPRQRAAAVVHELSVMLRDTVTALREGDADMASRTLARARASEGMLRDLRDASEEGMAVVRLSPFRRRHLPSVQVIAGPPRAPGPRDPQPSGPHPPRRGRDVARRTGARGIPGPPLQPRRGDRRDRRRAAGTPHPERVATRAVRHRRGQRGDRPVSRSVE